MLQLYQASTYSADVMSSYEVILDKSYTVHTLIMAILHEFPQYSGSFCIRIPGKHYLDCPFAEYNQGSLSDSLTPDFKLYLDKKVVRVNGDGECSVLYFDITIDP